MLLYVNKSQLKGGNNIIYLLFLMENNQWLLVLMDINIRNQKCAGKRTTSLYFMFSSYMFLYVIYSYIFLYCIQSIMYGVT